MKRRSFLKSALAGIAALGIDWNARAAVPDASTAVTASGRPLEITPPVLQNASETAVTVIWACSAPATGWIEYGTTEALGQKATGETDGLLPYDDRILRVRLQGLKPGQKYFYRVQTAPIDFSRPYNVRRGAAIASPIHTFTSLNGAADSGSFVVWNDTHQQVGTLQKLIGQLPKHSADLLFWNGDIFNTVDNEDCLIREILHPVGLEYAASRALSFVRGNHDTRGAYARKLRRVVEVPENRYYYVIRQGPIAFLVLDTGEDKPDAHREYSGLVEFTKYHLRQKSWLEAAIRESAFQNASFRVVLSHIPVFDLKDRTYPWAESLSKARIDFGISGHTHEYRYYEADDKRPYPLVIGGAHQTTATFFHGQASSKKLVLSAFSREGQQLGSWDVPRANAG